MIKRRKFNKLKVGDYVISKECSLPVYGSMIGRVAFFGKTLLHKQEYVIITFLDLYGPSRGLANMDMLDTVKCKKVKYFKREQDTFNVLNIDEKE